MDGAPAGYLLALPRVASLNPPVVFHVKFPATIAAFWSRSASPLLWVPRTSSMSRDQAILVDQATGASLSSDAVLLKIDRFGQRFQRRRRVQGTVSPVPVMVVLVLGQDLPQMA